MRNSLGDKVRLQHIYDAILEIESYVQTTTYDIFQSTTMMQYACVKQLEIIGEAANHLTPHFKKLYSEIQWREIISLRNILIHEYFGIDTKIIWDIIKTDMVSLKPQVKEIIEQI
ncbi:MAG: DUF86 domain-containing protein [Ignavibacteriales bacterium]|nr:DUF86 domain-containing protein [Ignavibacteriales bacterium]